MPFRLQYRRAQRAPSLLLSKRVNLDLAVVQLALQLLVVQDLAGGLHEVLLEAVVPIGTDGEQPGLRADVAHVGAVEAVGELDDGLPVDVAALGDGLRMDLEDLQPLRFVWFGNLDLAIQPAGTEEGGIQDVGTVGRHDHLDLPLLLEAVHLVEQLHEGALDLAVSAGALREAAAADGVDLVHEDDAGLMVLGEAEHLSDDAGGLADVLVDDGGRHDLEEGSVDVGGQGTGQEGLAGTGRPVQEDTLGGLSEGG